MECDIGLAIRGNVPDGRQIACKRRILLFLRSLDIELDGTDIERLSILEFQSQAQVERHCITGLIIGPALCQTGYGSPFLVDLSERGVGEGGLIETKSAALDDRSPRDDRRVRSESG